MTLPTYRSLDARGFDFTIGGAEIEAPFRELLAAVGMAKGDLQLTEQLPPSAHAALSEDRDGELSLAVLRTPQHGATGCASLTRWTGDAILRAGLEPQGESRQLGYFGDLRCLPSAGHAVRIAWREWYRDWIRRALQPEGATAPVDGLVTCVLDENTLAIRALTRGRHGFTYRPLVSYRTVGVYFDPTSAAPLPAPADVDRVQAIRVPGSMSVRLADPVSGQTAHAKFRTSFQRTWQVSQGTETPLEIRFFTLSELSLDGPWPPARMPALWRAIFGCAETIARECGRPALQISVPTSHHPALSLAVPPSPMTWDIPATLYQVELAGHAAPFPFRASERLCLDPGQL